MDSNSQARLARAIQLEVDAFNALRTCLVAITESKGGGFWQAQSSMPSALAALESIFRTASDAVERIAGGKAT